MNSGKNYCIDTSVIIDFFKGKIDLRDYIKNSDKVVIPSIVIGELLYGIENSQNSEIHVQHIDKFVSKFNVVCIDEKTAEYYSKVKTSLTKKGKVIAEINIWIAALCLQYDFVLFTQDTQFEEINNLAVVFK